MRTTVSARHGDISDELRARAVEVLERFGHLSPHALEGTALFDTHPIGFSVELRLHVRRGQILVSQVEDPDARTALDRAEEKLKRQLERAVAAVRGIGRSPSSST
jgi:ribosomal subunit interface protein